MSTTSNTYNQQQQPQNVKPASEQDTGYVQQAVTGATNLFNSATAAVSPYLPTSVTDALSNVTASTTGTFDPTTAYRNRQPHVGGVGDLGTRSTQDVTRLPEERQNPDPYNTTTHVGGVGDLGTNSTSDVVRLPEERANPDPLVTMGDFSSQGTRGVGGHPGFAGGVGDLGTKSDTDVARLPEERANPVEITSGKGGQDDFDEAGGLGGHGGRHHDITKDGSTGGRTGANYDVDHGLGMPHTRSVNPGATSNTTDGLGDRYSGLDKMREESSGTGPQETDSGAHGSSDQTKASQDKTQPPKKTDSEGHSKDESEDYKSPKEAGFPTGKPSLMDKVKGNVMIAAGKMKPHDDQDKIHQGQMLKETGKKINPEEEARKSGQNA